MEKNRLLDYLLDNIFFTNFLIIFGDFWHNTKNCGLLLLLLLLLFKCIASMRQKIEK